MGKKLVPILLALFITACTSSTRAPTTTALPSETPAPPETVTPTPLPPTATRQTGEAQPLIWNLQLSSQGQLVFRTGDKLTPNVPPGMPFYDAGSGTLFVGKGSDNSGFVNISGRAMHQSWSPDGKWLFYCEPKDIEQPFHAGEYFLWNTTNETSISLEEALDGSLAETDLFNFGKAFWSPDSQKLMFLELIRPAENNFDFGIVSIVDLENQTITHSEEFFRPYDIRWLHDNKFLVASSCGSPCTFLSTYEFPSMETWQGIPAISLGHFVASQDGTLVVNAGRFDPSKQVIDLIDIPNRELSTLWDIPEEEFPSKYDTEPSISPDNRYVVFALDDNTGERLVTRQYIFDRESGAMVDSFVDGEFVSWRPAGGMIVEEFLSNKISQYIYWPLNDSTSKQTILQAGSEIIDGDEYVYWDWSPDGKYVLLKVVDRELFMSELYLWEFVNGQPVRIADVNTKSPIETVWKDTSDGFFFALPDTISIYSLQDDSSEIIFSIND